MARILADLPDSDVKWLDQRAVEQGKSRASVLREAVASFKSQASGDRDSLEAGFGLWVRHGIAIDARDYDRCRRAEWTRPWDDDYDAARAESPDLFTPEDDRERAHYLALTRKGLARRDADGA